MASGVAYAGGRGDVKRAKLHHGETPWHHGWLQAARPFAALGLTRFGVRVEFLFRFFDAVPGSQAPDSQPQGLSDSGRKIDCRKISQSTPARHFSAINFSACLPSKDSRRSPAHFLFVSFILTNSQNPAFLRRLSNHEEH
jgi:hypothetical protein